MPSARCKGVPVREVDRRRDRMISRSPRSFWPAILLLISAGMFATPSACGDRAGRGPADSEREDGSDETGDDRRSDGIGAVPPADGSTPAEDLVTCEVVRVVDGDTIKVIYNGKVESVRYIGVDTPETVHPNKPIQPFGKEASALNKDLLTGGEVQLSFDLEQRDHYGRLLAYVYAVHDNRRVLVNLELVRAGLAKAFPYPPNTSYAELFIEAQDEAKVAKRGIWSSAE